MSIKDKTLFCSANCMEKTRHRHLGGKSDDSVDMFECTKCGHEKIEAAEIKKKEVKEIKISKKKNDIENAWG